MQHLSCVQKVIVDPENNTNNNNNKKLESRIFYNNQRNPIQQTGSRLTKQLLQTKL